MSHILGNAFDTHMVGHRNGLCPTDFSAVSMVAIADGDFVFPFMDGFDTCHCSPFSHYHGHSETMVLLILFFLIFVIDSVLNCAVDLAAVT